MNAKTVDIQVVTYNLAHYTRLSLEQLLTSSEESCRNRVSHNGTDSETPDVVRAFERYPRLHHLHHSPENLHLTEPTNWLSRASDGEYLGKVDDDTIVPDGWIETLVAAHERSGEL